MFWSLLRLDVYTGTSQTCSIWYDNLYSLYRKGHYNNNKLENPFQSYDITKKIVDFIKNHEFSFQRCDLAWILLQATQVGYRLLLILTHSYTFLPNPTEYYSFLQIHIHSYPFLLIPTPAPPAPTRGESWPLSAPSQAPTQAPPAPSKVMG